MRLKPKTQSLPSVKLKAVLPGEVHQDLVAYAEHYRQTYGQEITAEALAVEILDQFLQADAGFKRWKAARGDGQADPAAPAQEKAAANPGPAPAQPPFAAVHRPPGAAGS